MQRRHRWFAAAMLAAATLAGAGAVPAQTARSGGGANVQLVQEMQQLASERTALQAENERLKGELVDVRKERDSLKASEQTLDRRARESASALARSDAERLSSTEELTQTRAKMQELIGKFRETIQKLREVESEGATARESAAARERELNACVEHNVALYHLNDEVLTHFDRQGFWSRLAQAEPFTQIKRVRNENLIDEYRSRAQLQVTPGVKPDPGDTRPAPAANPSPPATPPDAATAH